MSPAMRQMEAYPRYLFGNVAGVLGQRVLEIGVGYGTYTALLREAGKEVLATDIDPERLRAVAERFAGDPLVHTERIDLGDWASIQALEAYQADSVICLNVLEHVRDDVAALAGLRMCVAPGAALGLIVPAHAWLFGRMDAEAGHFRRYTRGSLRDALALGGWAVNRVRYINLIGVAGWYYHNRLRKNAGLADAAVNRQMRGADRWLPRLARLTDPVFGRIAGLSVLAIGRA
jgi:SAM-dependent methyltransferase